MPQRSQAVAVVVSSKRRARGDVRSDVSCKLEIKVIPGASRSGIVGWLGETLKIRVAAPPEKGKANAAVEALMCEALDLPAGSTRIVSGVGSQRKMLQVRGQSRVEVLRRLAGNGD